MLWLGKRRVRRLAEARMSGIGTERLCRPVNKHFHYWRLTGPICDGAGLSQFDPKRKFCVNISRGTAGIIMGYLELFDFGEGQLR
jgi:hypothetical protein